MMTKCAGVLTPHASVDVATSTCAACVRACIRVDGHRRVTRRAACMCSAAQATRLNGPLNQITSVGQGRMHEGGSHAHARLDLDGDVEALHDGAVAVAQARVVQADAKAQAVAQRRVLHIKHTAQASCRRLC